jgi:O-antigen/teichoic acid export membrane protein
MLATDTLVYGLASAVNKSFALILFPFLTRTLSVEDYGRLDFALYAAALLGLVIIWGQDSAVARLFFEYEKLEERQQVISQALVAMIANLAIASVAFLLLSRTALVRDAFGADSARILLLLAIYAPLSGLLSFCQALLKWTFRRNQYIAIALGVPATTLALILSLSQLGNFGPVTALAAMVAVSGLFTCVALFTIRRWLVKPQGADFIRKLVPLALPYGAIACISAVSPLFERAVISGRFGAADLGLYAAAAKIASVAMMLSIAFQMGWGPFSYSIYKQPGAARTYSLVLRAFTAIMCLAVLGISALSEPLTALIAGDRYRAASIFVFPLAMAFAVQSIGWITEIGIHLSKRTYLNLIGFGIFLVISLSGIVFLSRVVGIIGVPVAALTGQLAMLVTSAFLAQKAFRLEWSYGLPAMTLAIALASGVVAMVLKYRDPLVAAWPIYTGGMILVIGANILVGISRNDWRTLAQLTRRWRMRGAVPDERPEKTG